MQGLSLGKRKSSSKNTRSVTLRAQISKGYHRDNGKENGNIVGCLGFRVQGLGSNWNI